MNDPFFVTHTNNTLNIDTLASEVLIIRGHYYKIVVDNLEEDDVVKTYNTQNGFRSTFNINQESARIGKPFPSSFDLSSCFLNEDTLEKIRSKGP